jgi:DNA-binding IclR family transcriptional regulator
VADEPFTERESAGGVGPSVPAITRAVRVLSALIESPEGATLTAVAARAAISKSTAFNLLRTMTAEGLLTFDAASRRYDLGPKLIELGAVAVGRTPPILAARSQMESLARATGLACLAIQRMPEGHFVVVEKIESRKDIKVTIEVGERFPNDAPLLSRIWHAWAGDRPGEQVKYTPQTLTDPQEISKAAARVAAQGFGDVYGEYIANLNVVGFPVFDKHARLTLIVTLLGIGDELAPEHVASLAPNLVRAARQVTVSTGGRLPDGYPDA